MISTFATSLSPPTPPSDSTIGLAMMWLQVAVDPQATKARSDELLALIDAARAATAEANGARDAAVAAQKAAADLVTAQAKLTADQSAVAEARLQNDNAASALRVREAALDKRAGELEKLANDVAAKETALAAQRESMRAALG